MRPGIWSDDWNSSSLSVAAVQESCAPSPRREKKKKKKKHLHPSVNRLTDTYVGRKRKVEKKGD